MRINKPYFKNVTVNATSLWTTTHYYYLLTTPSKFCNNVRLSQGSVYPSATTTSNSLWRTQRSCISNLPQVNMFPSPLSQVEHYLNVTQPSNMEQKDPSASNQSSLYRKSSLSSRGQQSTQKPPYKRVRVGYPGDRSEHR